MPSIARTVYTTVVNKATEYEGPSLETAIRTWDSLTLAQPSIGGVQVQSFDSSDIMVRDGWVLHVSGSGHVYLNPRVAQA